MVRSLVVAESHVALVERRKTKLKERLRALETELIRLKGEFNTDKYNSKQLGRRVKDFESQRALIKQVGLDIHNVTLELRKPPEEMVAAEMAELDVVHAAVEFAKSSDDDITAEENFHTAVDALLGVDKTWMSSRPKKRVAS